MTGQLLRFRDQIAFHQGPYQSAPVWTDVTDVVRPGSQCALGRQNRNGAFEATATNFIFDNKTGNFTPFNPDSPYADLDDALPYRRQVEYPIGSGVFYPFWAGVVSDVKAGFEGAARGVATLAVQQRLAMPGLQPLDSIVQGQIERSHPDHFWAFDDGEDPVFESVAKDFRGEPFPSLYIRNTGTLGSIQFGVGDSPGPDEDGSRVAFTPYDSYDGYFIRTRAGQETLAFFASHESYVVLNSSGVGHQSGGVSIVYEFRDVYGSGCKVEIDSAGRPAAIVRDAFAGDLAKITSATPLEPGVDYAVGMTVINDSADVSTLTLWVDGESQGTATYPMQTWSVTEACAGAGMNGDLFFSGTLANLAYWHDPESESELGTRRGYYTNSLFGYDDDTADVRVARILDLAGIPPEWFTAKGTFTRKIATQATGGKTFIQLLKDIESAEIGRIFADASGDLGLASSSAYYFPAQSVTLSASRHFDLVGTFGVDPDNSINHWKGQRQDGVLQRYQAPQNIVDKRGQKRLDGGSNIPLTNDDDVAQIGHWLVSTTAAPALRFPSVSVSLAKIQRDETLVKSLLTLDEGDQVNLIDLPVGSPVSQFVGFVERISKVENGEDLIFNLTLSKWLEIGTFFPVPMEYGYNGPSVYNIPADYGHLSAGSPSVLYPDSDRYGEDPGSIATMDSLTSSETSITVIVAEGSPALTARPEDLPLDLGIGGERVTCTSVISDTSPQTLNISRGKYPTNARPHEAGETVTIWPAGIFGV